MAIPAENESLGKNGYDCTFVKPTSQQFDCAVCLLILRKPHLTDCCGKRFCKACIDPIRLGGKACPWCKESSFSTMIDRNLERELIQMEVYCTHKEGGCSWTGELRKLEEHVDPLKGDCDCVEVQCPWECGKAIERRYLQEHKSRLCQKRPWYTNFEDENVKRLAEELDSVFQENKSLKKDVSEMSAKVESVRRESEAVSTENQSLRAEISELRSEVLDLSTKMDLIATENQLLRKETVTKMDSVSNENANLSLLIEELRTRQSEGTNERALLQKKVESVVAQMEAFGEHHSTSSERSSADAPPTPASTSASEILESPALNMPTVPFSFTMRGFKVRKKSNAEWYSPPFYTHQNGYKMCVRVDANGVGNAKGSHVSLHVYIMRGEFDDQLSWPFKGTVVVQLLNQRQDSAHHEKTVDFPDTVAEVVSSRVTVGDKAMRGQGYSQFAAHIDLAHDLVLQRQFLRDDCLKFQITAVEQRSYSKLFKWPWAK